MNEDKQAHKQLEAHTKEKEKALFVSDEEQLLINQIRAIQEKQERGESRKDEG